MTAFDSRTGLHLREDGPRDAPALVLLHGTAASLRTWDPMLPYLTGTHRVLRIDLPGCGQSAVPLDGSYALADQVHQIGTALDFLGIEDAVVTGHSSGGAVATALAEQRPALVRALVLLNTGPGMHAYIAEDLRLDPALWPDLSDEQLRRIAAPAFAAGFEIPQALLDELRGMDLEVFAATSEALRAYLDERPLPRRLAPLGKPLLVLFGEDDRRWRASSAADYEAVPGATVDLLTGLGHSPNVEDPSRTAARLLAFTASLVPQRG